MQLRIVEEQHRDELKSETEKREQSIALARASLTPEAIFGDHFHDILLRVGSWWNARAEFAQERKKQNLPIEETVSHEASGGLQLFVLNAGMIALALYDRRRARRDLSPATLKQTSAAAGSRRRKSKRDAGVDVPAVLARRDHDPIEMALIESFREAQADATSLTAMRTADSASNQSPTTRKQLLRMIINTPAEWWYTAYQVMLSRCESILRSGVDPRPADLLYVVHTVTLGFFLATGSRESEVYGIQLDINFNPATRHLQFTPGERKNHRALICRVQEALVPQWLLDFYLQVVRPRLLVNGQPGERHLLMTSGGRPVRPGSAIMFLQAVARSAVSTGKLTVPAEPYEFGEHVIRMAMGHWVRRKFGSAKAATFLGDNVATVDKYYSILDGTELDLSGLQSIEGFTPAVDEIRSLQHVSAHGGVSVDVTVPERTLQSASARTASYADKLLTIGEMLQRGLLDKEEFDQAKRDLKVEYAK
jgi:hypothetical protein